jgi:signal transduction histidine kinase/CheY-like chemotaxis protein
LDCSSTLAGVAHAAVPWVADWCIVHVEELQSEGLSPMAAHVDSSKEPLVLELATRLRPHLAYEPQRPRRTASLNDLCEWLRGDVELVSLFERIGIASSMFVPICARGERLGVIVLSSADADRVYDENDLGMAEELGRRAAVAVENARLYRDVREADRQKDEFLAMLSHELRNPLAPIVNAVEIMKYRGGDSFAKERAVISRHVQHIVRLVDDLLDVARVTRGKIELETEVCELSSLIGKAVEMTAPLIADRGQRLWTFVPQDGLLVVADPARLVQAIANLLANASKYTERRGEIAVVALADGATAVIRVRDSGIGIAPEALPRIFDLFVQERQTLDRFQGGLGVGLTVVKGLVALHRGSVSAHSEGSGKGSEFVIRLPLAPPRALEGPGPVTPPSSRRLLTPSEVRPLRVLVVDDNVDAADMLREALGLLGCTVDVAYDGETALALAPDFAPDLALLDIGLPLMSGYELAGQLRSLCPAPRRIVAITGYGQESDHVRSRGAGFDEHVVKPIDLATLGKILDRIDGPGGETP